LTGFVLKLIALAVMLTDHLGAVFPAQFPFVFRVIGRAAFPLYVFLIAEGFRRTRNMPKFLARLGAFAVISQLPFCVAFSHMRNYSFRLSFISDVNIFYTLFLGAACVYVWQITKGRSVLLTIVPLISLVLAALAAKWLDADYGAWGVLFVFFAYIAKNKAARLCVMTGFLIYFYGSFLWEIVVDGAEIARYANMYDFGMLAASLASVAVAAFYNGKRGPSLKWAFYAAYPAHLLILGGIYWFIRLRPL